MNTFFNQYLYLYSQTQQILVLFFNYLICKAITPLITSIMTIEYFTKISNIYPILQNCLIQFVQPKIIVFITFSQQFDIGKDVKIINKIIVNQSVQKTNNLDIERKTRIITSLIFMNIKTNQQLIDKEYPQTRDIKPYTNTQLNAKQ